MLTGAVVDVAVIVFLPQRNFVVIDRFLF